MSDLHRVSDAYQGPRPYKESEADRFFGRTVEAEVITANLRGSRLTLLYGASGVGKTSLLTAGVAPRIRQAAIRRWGVGGLAGPPTHVLVMFRDWSGDPITGLREEVDTACRKALGDIEVEPVALKQPLGKFLDAWTLALGTELRPRGTLLIVLDQFEDYFRYQQTEDRSGSFAVEFASLVQQSELRINFLISIREDALAKLDRFKGSIPNLFNNILRLDPLKREEARKVITGPLKSINYVIEPGLDDEILEDLRAILLSSERAVPKERADPSIMEVPSDLSGYNSYLTLYLNKVMRSLCEDRKAQELRELRKSTLNGELGGVERIVHEKMKVSLEEIAGWEREFHGLKLFWVVLPRFLGDPFNRFFTLFFEAMKYNIKRGVRYVYMLRRDDSDRFEVLCDLYQKLATHLESEPNFSIRGKLVGALIDKDSYENLLEGNYYWIANPLSSEDRAGYQVILNENELPTGGLWIGETGFQRELLTIIERLSLINYVVKRAADVDKKDVTVTLDARINLNK